MPAVFVIGTSTLFMTRLIFYNTHPDYFVNNSPTISRTAAFAPAGDVFMVGMCIVTILGFISWGIALQSNLVLERSRDQVGRRLAWAATIMAWLAVSFLALLAIVDSNWNGRLHEIFSICFFFLQMVSFLLEAAWLRRSRRLGLVTSSRAHAMGTQRTAVSLLVAGLSVALLILYLTHKSHLVSVERYVDYPFVLIEHTISVLCFAYPTAQYRELVAYWKEREEATLSPGAIQRAAT